MSVLLCALFLLIITVFAGVVHIILELAAQHHQVVHPHVTIRIPHVPLITYVDVVVLNHALIIRPTVPLFIFTGAIIYYEI